MVDPVRIVSKQVEDAPWKRDVERAISELARELDAAKSEIAYLKGRVN